MKKLLALISSISVCASAVAVSVLSYFSHPSKTNAEGTPSSLVTTPIDSSGSFPVITIPKSDLVNATSDFFFHIVLCPTGWLSVSPYVSPSSYGTYSGSYRFDFLFRWDASGHYFNTYFTSYFESGHAGQNIFALLNLYDPYDLSGLPPLHLLLTSVSPDSSEYSAIVFNFNGAPLTPSALPSDNVVFQLSGLLGVDYEYWRYYTSYQAGHGDGYSDGYSEGHSAGFQDGHVEGYGAGKIDGTQEGYSAGDSAGYSRGLADASRQFGMWDLFSNAFGSVANVLSIQIFPGLSIGLLISVPIAFAFILWLIHVLKG